LNLKEACGNEHNLQNFAGDVNTRGYRKAANTIGWFLLGLMNYTTFPKQHQKRIRTTNVMERVKRELKRRTKVVGVFHSEESLLRLVGSILMDINEEGVRQKIFADGRRMIRQGYRAQRFYRKSETLPQKKTTYN